MEDTIAASSTLPCRGYGKELRRRAFPAAITADTPLRKRERVFVDEYLVPLNGAAAAIKARYSERNARVLASRLLAKVNIAATVEKGFEERQARTPVNHPNQTHTTVWFARTPSAVLR